jgi:hypothetical protein
MKKKTFCILLAIIACVTLMMATAGAESDAVATTATVIDWSTLITQAVVWAIGALAAVAAWALKKYVYPWFLTAVVPWLKTHNLVAVAEIAVKYAEAELGRYTGEEKWELAIELMKAKGFDVDSNEVVAALKAAWETLDLQQISAGVKDATNATV